VPVVPPLPHGAARAAAGAGAAARARACEPEPLALPEAPCFRQSSFARPVSVSQRVLVEPLAPALPLAAPLVLLRSGWSVVLPLAGGAAARPPEVCAIDTLDRAKKRRCDRGCKYFQVHRRTLKSGREMELAADKRAINVPASDKK